MQLGITMFGDSRFDLATNQIQSPEIRMKEIIEEIKLMDEVGSIILALVNIIGRIMWLQRPKLFWRRRPLKPNILFWQVQFR